LDSILSSMGVDPVAILTKAYGERSRKRPRGRPRSAAPSGESVGQFLDELTRDAWVAWDLAPKLGAAPRFERLNRASRFIIRLVYVLSVLRCVKQKELPPDRPDVRAMNRWLALEREKLARRTRGARMPTRGERIYVPIEERLVPAATIEKDVERNAPWLRDK
jgi:hypothetical protein